MTIPVPHAPSTRKPRADDAALTTRSTTELLRLLVGDDVARAYDALGSLRRLRHLPPDHDLDPGSVVRLRALEILIERRLAEPVPARALLNTPEATTRHFRHLAILEHEELHAAFLDVKLGVIDTRWIASGSASEVVVSASAILRPAVLLGADAIALAHNHPSGDPIPSRADRLLTTQVRNGAAAIGVKLIDHVVLAPGGRAYSLESERTIPLDGALP